MSTIVDMRWGPSKRRPLEYWIPACAGELSPGTGCPLPAFAGTSFTGISFGYSRALRSTRLHRSGHGCDDLGRVGEVALGAFRHHLVADAYFENAARARHQGCRQRELLLQGGGRIGGAPLVTARLAVGDGDFLHGLLLVAVSR